MRVVAPPFADDEGVPVGADGLLHQRRGGGPAGVVEGGLVQRPEDLPDGIPRGHTASPRRRVPAPEDREPDC